MMSVHRSSTRKASSFFLHGDRRRTFSSSRALTYPSSSLPLPPSPLPSPRRRGPARPQYWTLLFQVATMSLISQNAPQKRRLKKTGADDDSDEGTSSPVALDAAEAGKKAKPNHICRP